MKDMPSTQPEEIDATLRRDRGWVERFSVAWRGVKITVHGETSFRIHLLVTVLLLLASVILQMSRLEWCLVGLCITMVLGAELFNTSLERIARAITREEDSNIRDALDIASGAVLVVVFGVVLVGAMLLGVHAVDRLVG